MAKKDVETGEATAVVEETPQVVVPDTVTLSKEQFEMLVNNKQPAVQMVEQKKEELPVFIIEEGTRPFKGTIL